MFTQIKKSTNAKTANTKRTLSVILRIMQSPIFHRRSVIPKAYTKATFAGTDTTNQTCSPII